MSRQAIHTDAAPKAIGTYSQAVRCGNTVYLAGQIGLDPDTMQLAAGIEAQVTRRLKTQEAQLALSGDGADEEDGEPAGGAGE